MVPGRGFAGAAAGLATLIKYLQNINKIMKQRMSTAGPLINYSFIKQSNKLVKLIHTVII